jgi:PAS domain S-box-containing protein
MPIATLFVNAKLIPSLDDISHKNSGYKNDTSQSANLQNFIASLPSLLAARKAHTWQTRVHLAEHLVEVKFVCVDTSAAERLPVATDKRDDAHEAQLLVVLTPQITPPRRASVQLQTPWQQTPQTPWQQESTRAPRAARETSQIKPAPTNPAARNLNSQLHAPRLITSDIVVLQVDRNWQVSYVNDVAINVLGLPKGRVPAVHLFELLPQLNVSGNIFARGYRQAMETGQPVLIEGRPLDSRFAGQWHSVYAIPNDHGLMIHAYDNTARRQSELALARAYDEKSRELSGISDGVIAVNYTWQIVYANENVMRAFPQGIIGRNYWDVFPQQPNNIYKQKYQEVFDTGKPVRFEARSSRTGIWREYRVFPSLEGIIIYAADIEVLKDVQASLERALQEKEDIINSITESFSILDKNWVFTYTNSKISDISPKAIGKNYFDVFPQNKGTIFEEKYRQAFETQQPLKFEAIMTSNKRWGEVRVYPRPEGIAIFSSDIHERKQLESRLEQALQEKEDVLNSITDSVIVMDHDWNFIYANDNALQFHAKSLIGRNYWDVFPKNQDSIYVRHYQQVMDTGQPVRFVAKMTISGMWCEVRVFPHPEGIAIYIADINELKRKEDALKNALAAKEMLLKEVHHRTKNNMQLISSMLSIQAHILTDDTSRNAILESRDRINVLADVHKLMYQQLEAETIDAYSHLSALIHKLSRSMGRADVNVELDIDAIELSIQQAIPLGLIVNELVTNIFKHGFVESERPATISLRLQAYAGHILLELQDNGAGLPAGFDPNQGSLGMTIIQALTGQLAGTLNMTNRQAGGVLTRLSFPQEDMPHTDSD